eukprot:PITA_05262
MASRTETVEVVILVEPRRLWNAIVKDGHNFYPKALPEAFTSVTLLEGDGGVGTIKQLNFTPGKRDYSFIKERVDEVDEQNFVYKFTIIGGGALGTKLSAANFVVKYVPRNEGGSVATWTINYETLSGVQSEYDGRVKEIKENSIAQMKKVEQYLLSNPNLYN